MDPLLLKLTLSDQCLKKMFSPFVYYRAGRNQRIEYFFEFGAWKADSARFSLIQPWLELS
jgi:hypothetical protein